MTLKEIKALFAPGTKVRVSRTGGKPLTVAGNLAATVLPANDVVGEERTIKAVKSEEWVMSRPNGLDVHTTYPKASQVAEAKPGFLRFNYDNGLVITIEAI